MWRAIFKGVLWLVLIFLSGGIGALLGYALLDANTGGDQTSALVGQWVGFLIFAAPVVWIGWPRRRYEEVDDPPVRERLRRRRRRRYQKN